jgi:phosphate-selective porin OprO/OprP
MRLAPALASFSALTTLVAFAAAQTDPPTSMDADARIRALEKRLAALEAAKTTDGEGGVGIPKKKEEGIVALENEDAVIRLRPVLQADGRFFVQGGIDTFVARRIRPAIEATFYDRFDVRITPELAQATPSVVDAFANLRLFEAIQIRAGKFKAPVGLERNQADQDLHFVERGFVTAFVPDREIGVMLWGEILDGTIVYGAGIFDGAYDGAQSDGDNNDEKDVEGRILVRPFATTSIAALSDLTIGAAATSGRHDGALPGYKTTGQNTFFSWAADANAGREQRFVPQASWYVGPVGVLAEYARVHEAVLRNGGSTGANLQAYTVIVSAFVTGEHASYGTVKPKRAFDPDHDGWGALEIDARISGFQTDDNTFTWPAKVTDPTKSAQKAFEWAVGAQWHYAPAIKFVIDYFQTKFDGGAATGDRPTEKVFIGRFQIAY